MTSDSFPELRAIAVELATAAGALVREGAARARSSVETKSSDVDVVTETDRASEALIVSTLQHRRPGDGIIGEEGTSVTSETGVEWVVDPLDGTVNFLYSIPSFAVSVGAVVDGTPVAGAVFNPMTDELYAAATGHGATLNGVPIAVNPKRELALALVGTGFAYDASLRGMQAETLVGVMPHVRDIRRSGSAALDLCGVARGRLDAYYEINVNPWDIAAGYVIATEAGAVISHYSDDVRTRMYFAACTTEVYEGLRSLVSP